MDDFQYVRTLRGAIYGKVALVQHRRSGTFYALKMMSIAHMSARRAIAGARVCEDGDAELRVLRRLSGNSVFCGSERVAIAQSTECPLDQEQSVKDTSATTWSVRPQWQVREQQQQYARNARSLEAAALHALDRDHNNLLLLHKDFVDVRTNARCLVLDYCPFGELYDHVQSAPGRTLGIETARRFFQQIARAVRFIHAHNVAHRDISLENVLVDAHHECRLADFGLASEHGVACTGKVGKAFYMAPEVLASAPHERYNGLKADIWSLGVLLFIMVIGAPPFENAVESDARFRVVKTQGVAALLRIWQVEDRVSDDLCDLLSFMLRVDAHARVSIDKVWRHPWVHDNIDVETLALESSFGADAIAMASPLSLSLELDNQQQITKGDGSFGSLGEDHHQVQKHESAAKCLVTEPQCAPEPHEDSSNGSPTQASRRSARIRKRIKIAIVPDSAEPLLLPDSVRGDRDSSAFADPSPLSSDIRCSDDVHGRALDPTFAPALAHERSPWSRDSNQRDVSALFAPHSTPTAGPRECAVGGRKVTLRSLCFGSKGSRVDMRTHSWDSLHRTGRDMRSDDKDDGSDTELMYDLPERKRRTSLSVSCAMLNQATRLESGLAPTQSSQRRLNLFCRVCHHELESEQSGVKPVKAEAAATTTTSATMVPDEQLQGDTTQVLSMCTSCFDALPLTAQAANVLVLSKAGASIQLCPPAQVA